MYPSVLTMPWLMPAPPDFASRCRCLEIGGPELGPAIQFLAGFRLTAQQSLSLSRVIRRALAAGADVAPLSQFHLGILASATFDLLIDCIPAAAARHGVAVKITSTPYDQVMQQALDPGSEINLSRPDAVLVAVDHRWLQLERAARDGEAQVRDAVERLRAVVGGLRAHGNVPAILQTVPAPQQAPFGSFDRRTSGSARAMIDEANRRIVSLAGETGSYLLDTAALAERAGTDRWFDPVQWVSYKLPFSAECFPIYADMLGRLLGAIRGKARKCLVLDLDNTIWGGAIGDDGPDGICVGHGNARGEAFLSVQQAALDLSERGIILAVCSKNSDEIARGPFRDHPDMLLRENHIAVFQANWSDKPGNLETIAEKLNIGLDALVLLDDNPVERAQVRAVLPGVAVPELPNDPSWYAWFLSAAGYFEAVSFSMEDRLRSESYSADAKRHEAMTRAGDLGNYLSSLEMAIVFGRFDRKNRQRITQLINKTNQFNLTTRRYTEAEVAAIETDTSLYAVHVRLGDRFGNLGIVAVAICRPAHDDAWHIDTWLMSCRVLGRRIEEAMLSEIVREACRRNVRRLIGTYAPTAKNAMVREHYEKLGFKPLESAQGNQQFELAVADYTCVELPFTIEEQE